MTRFFVFDEQLMRRCQDACAKRTRISLSGTDAQDGSTRTFEGLVRCVEDYPLPGRRRWRITLK